MQIILIMPECLLFSLFMNDMFGNYSVIFGKYTLIPLQTYTLRKNFKGMDWLTQIVVFLILMFD